MSVNKNQLRAAAYCRVSTEKEDQANSLSSQRSYFEKYISKQYGWTLVEVYFDEGKSGTTTEKRDGFNRMIADCKSGLIDTILTKEVSRFARNTVDTLEYTRMLKSIGVNVIFLSDNIDTAENDGELRLSIMSTIAQEESRKTSERVKWGQKRQMEKGIVFGRSLLGYDVKDGKLTINEEGAEIVRLIFHKYIVEGKGTHVIARELYEAGIKPMRVTEWSNTVILRVLRNEKYVGDLVQGKTYTPNSLNHKKKYQQDKKQFVTINNHHEPIISREIWNLTQAELHRRTLTAEQKSKHSNRYWCSGRIICGECGHKYVKRTKKLASGELYYAWRCSSSQKHGSKKQNKYGETIGCNNHSINEKVLLEGVYFVLRMIKLNKDKLISEMKSEIKSVMRLNSDDTTEKMKQKIVQIEQYKLNLGRKLAEGLISDDDFKLFRKSYDDDIAFYQGKIAEAQQRGVQFEAQTRRLNEYIDYIHQTLTFDEPNEHICGEIIENITVCIGHEFEVQLKSVPFFVRLLYTTKGRGQTFTPSFKAVDVVELNTDTQCAPQNISLL